MALSLATGTKVSIGSTLGASYAVTAVTNAAEAVLTVASGHGLTTGDYVAVRSGWSLLDYVVARVKTVVSDAVTLEGINTTSTDRYPAGSGAGSIQEITGWTEITQIKKDGGLSVAGGEPKYAPSSTLDDPDDKQIPDGRSVTTFTMSVYDDPSLPWYPVVDAISDANTVSPLRMVFANGSRTLTNGYWSMAKTPVIAAGQVNSLGLAFSATCRATRYAS